MLCRPRNRPGGALTKSPHKWIFWSRLLVGILPACGGDPNAGKTCEAITITYNGSKAGPAYVRVLFSSVGGHGGYIFDSAPSIQFLMAGENGAVHCVTRGPGDIPFTAAAWIDLSGTSAANCADPSSAQCQPSTTDPQAKHTGVELYGQTTQIHLDVVDPP
jgi:hypothetical protein